MARARTKTLGNTLEIPRAFTRLYGKNPNMDLLKEELGTTLNSTKNHIEK